MSDKWLALASYPLTTQAPEACPNCMTSAFSWHVYVFANDSAPGHNLMGLHDVHVTGLLSCDLCSETVARLDADQIADALNYVTRLGGRA